MNRRELLAGAAAILAGVSEAGAFGLGKEGARGGFGRAGAVLGGVRRAVRSSDARVSTFCDSWSAQQYADGPHTIQSAQSPLTWWAGLSGQTPIWVNNTGVSGERSDQWFARLPAILADVSKWVYVTTPQNDIGQAFSGYTAAGGPYAGQAVTMSNINAVTQANFASFAQQIIAAGKTPIFLSLAGATNFVASQITARNVYNTWLQAFCAATNSVFVDARNVLTDGSLAAVTYLAGYAMPDGGHPTNIGSYFLGKALWQNPAFSVMAARNLLPISTASGQAFGTQKNVNCLFGTVTGGSGSTGFTGDDPSGFQWSPSGTAATVVASDAPGTFGNDIIRTETYTGAVAQEMRSSQTITTGIAGSSGKTVRATGQIDVSAGATNLLGIDCRSSNTVDSVTASGIDFYSQVASAGPFPTSEAYTITFLTPPMVLPAGTLINAIGWSIRSRSTALGSGGSVFRQRRSGLYLD